jgi:hypothetical protein
MRLIDEADAVCSGIPARRRRGVADILWGEASPSGGCAQRFPMVSFLCHNHKPAGRLDDYADSAASRSSFGFGHSYADFRYEGLIIAPAAMAWTGQPGL